MPRKNCNARPRPGEMRPNPNIRPPRYDVVSEGYIPMGPRLDAANPPQGGPAALGRKHGESGVPDIATKIVREHRQMMDDRRGTMDEKATQTFQPYRVLPQAQPSLIHRVFGRINWAKIFDIVCMGLAILAIAAISGVMFFGPISWREFIR